MFIQKNFRTMGFQTPEQADKEKEEWRAIIDGIVAKRTHESAFQELFDKILKDKQHEYHRQARTLWMLYDFTPIQPVKKE